MKSRNSRSHFLDNPNSFMTENTSLGNCRNVSLENMQISPADRGRSNPYDSVRRLNDLRLWFILQSQSMGSMENEGAHRVYIVSVIIRFYHCFSSIVVDAHDRFYQSR